MPPKYSDVKTSTEEPKNDYFNANILINFPFCGNYIIQIDLFLLDEMDIVWRYTAEKHQILVKVEEDPTRQKLFAALQAAAASATNTATAAPSNSQQPHQKFIPSQENSDNYSDPHKMDTQ